MVVEINSPRILVVDDERSIRRFLNTSLTGQYSVLEASTGQEALAGRYLANDVILLISAA
jgi:CheY-like chemotaxis protein